MNRFLYYNFDRFACVRINSYADPNQDYNINLNSLENPNSLLRSHTLDKLHHFHKAARSFLHLPAKTIDFLKAIQIKKQWTHVSFSKLGETDVKTDVLFGCEPPLVRFLESSFFGKQFSELRENRSCQNHENG